MKNQGMYLRRPKVRGAWAEMCFMTRATELGFLVTKPWRDAPYDLLTDHRGNYSRVQVKCTISKRDNSYVCTVCSNHIPYRPDQLDFFAALVIPVDTWYILPILATNNQPSIVLSPHLKKSKYGQYQEAWHLLMQDK